MLKAARCQRLQERGARGYASPPCHCEKRSDVAIRTPCGSTEQNAVLRAHTKGARNLPKQQPTCQAFLRGRGLPHQCAHWFAMTCRRQRRACVCRDAAIGRRQGHFCGCKGVLLGECAGGCEVAPVVRSCGANTRQVSACHCEERSDVAIRTPCGSAKRKAILWANTQLLRICPKDYQLAKFLCGDADCRTSVRTGSQ